MPQVTLRAKGIDATVNAFKGKSCHVIERSHLFSFLFKGSIECRLLTSVFYDFGKSVYWRCPYSKCLQNQETQDYLRSSLDNFLTMFPNLNSNDPSSPVYGHKVTVGSGSTYTPYGFIKRAARNGFTFAHPNKRGSKIDAPKWDASTKLYWGNQLFAWKHNARDTLSY